MKTTRVNRKRRLTRLDHPKAGGKWLKERARAKGMEYGRSRTRRLNVCNVSERVPCA